MEKYKDAIQSLVVNKREMKKEWENEQVAMQLLICELLVNGTPYSAIPENIRTVDET